MKKKENCMFGNESDNLYFVDFIWLNRFTTYLFIFFVLQMKKKVYYIYIHVYLFGWQGNFFIFFDQISIATHISLLTQVPILFYFKSF